MENFADICHGSQMADSCLLYSHGNFFLVFSKAVSSKIQTSVSVKVSRLLQLVPQRPMLLLSAAHLPLPCPFTSLSNNHLIGMHRKLNSASSGLLPGVSFGMHKVEHVGSLTYAMQVAYRFL